MPASETERLDQTEQQIITELARELERKFNTAPDFLRLESNYESGGVMTTSAAKRPKISVGRRVVGFLTGNRPQESEQSTDYGSEFVLEIITKLTPGGRTLASQIFNEAMTECGKFGLQLSSSFQLQEMLDTSPSSSSPDFDDPNFDPDSYIRNFDYKTLPKIYLVVMQFSRK